MGMCFATNNNMQQRTRIDIFYKVSENNLNSQQQFLLKLIFNDLAQRIPQKALNLQNFLLFFHKNGFWGARLFQLFAPYSNYINEQQFLDGMGKLSKIEEQKKIELLFKFFSSSSIDTEKKQLQLDEVNEDGIGTAPQQKIESAKQKGVKFEQFLVMLYNYPKQDLKQILNDKDFFEKEIRHSLVTIGENHRLQSVYNLGLPLNKKDHVVFRMEDKQQGSESATQETEILPSMLGKDILKQIKLRQTDQTTLKLNYGDKTLQVKTNNIHHLVKKFAINMFKSLNLDINNGYRRLNLRQFTQWIKQHNTLYKNYYEGFHNDIWEYDPYINKCKFLSIPTQKQALAKYQVFGVINKSFVMLKHSFIIICQQDSITTPFDILFLQGLEVNKIFQQKKGYGFSISHRDGFYSEKKIFLKNQTVRQDWNQYLKYYKGETIENLYALGRKIGTGKFSVVYEATNKETKNQVAIKVIEFKQLDLSARKMIAHQSSIMQILSHPLLVQFKSCIQTRTHIYIITELCPGKDLFQMVKDSKHLDQKQSAAIIQQVIVGVRYLHSLGIIHRDLKPENVMVDFDLREKKVQTVKIIDFGFANYLTALTDLTPDQVLAGTPNYIAPELLRGQKITFKCDNFAIGSILYFMYNIGQNRLSGNLPFNSHSLSEIFVKTIQCKFTFKGKLWDKVSNLAKDLISRFLESDSQKRISLDDALLHPWFRQFRQKSTKTITDRQSIQTEKLTIETSRETSY